MRLVARQAEHRIDAARRVGASALADELIRGIESELDYLDEANAGRRFAKNLDGSDIHVPGVFPTLCASTVLVMEEVPGCTIADDAAVDACGVPREELARRLLRSFLRQILQRRALPRRPAPRERVHQPERRPVAHRLRRGRHDHARAARRAPGHRDRHGDPERLARRARRPSPRGRRRHHRPPLARDRPRRGAHRDGIGLQPEAHQPGARRHGPARPRRCRARSRCSAGRCSRSRARSACCAPGSTSPAPAPSSARADAERHDGHARGDHPARAHPRAAVAPHAARVDRGDQRPAPRRPADAPDRALRRRATARSSTAG